MEQETKPGVNLWEDFQTATKALGIKELLGLGEVAGEKKAKESIPRHGTYSLKIIQ